MHSLVHRIEGKQLLAQELPLLSASIVIAEFFYKFHSFTLECLAFLGTWYLLSAAVAVIRRK